MKVYVEITPPLGKITAQKYLSGSRCIIRELIKNCKNTSQIDLVFMMYSHTLERFREMDLQKLTDMALGLNEEETEPWTGRINELDGFERGSVLLDIDTVSDSKVKRSFLYPKFKEKGLNIVSYVSDVMPILNPEQFQGTKIYRYMSYISACIGYSDIIVTDSQECLSGLEKICEQTGEKKKTYLLARATELTVKPSEEAIVPERLEEFTAGKYIYITGFSEGIRVSENMAEALESALSEDNLSIVFTFGSSGFTPAAYAKLQSSKFFGKRILFHKPSDQDEAWHLYNNAYIILTADAAGTAEGIHFGKPLLARDTKEIREIFHDSVVYYSETETEQALFPLLKDSAAYSSAVSRQEKFTLVTWNEFFTEMFHKVNAFKQDTSMVCPCKVRQIVVFGGNSERCADTLAFYDHMLPFISEAVVFIGNGEPDPEYKGRLQVRVVKTDLNIRSSSAQLRLIENNDIDETFIFSYDNIRPLRVLSAETFSFNSCYNAFFSTDIQGFLNKNADEILKNELSAAYDLLRKNELPTLLYAFQMQLISKKMLLKLKEELPETGKENVELLSVYFNFYAPRYADMCPQQKMIIGFDDEQRVFVLSDFTDVLFEYYSEKNYDADMPFGKYSKGYTENAVSDNIGKLSAFYNKMHKAQNAEGVYSSYMASYMKKKLIPGFAAYVSGNTVAIHTPEKIELSGDSTYTLHWSFDPKIKTALHISEVTVSYWFTGKSENQTKIDSFDLVLDKLSHSFFIKTPCEAGKYELSFGFSFDNQEIVKKVSLNAVIL